jgi:hypothetical protein
MKMLLTVVCPRGHSIQATSELGGRQVRCPECQALVTIPASGKSSSGRAAGADATLTVSPDRVETVASGQPPSTLVAGPSRRQSVVGRYRLAGLAACAVALAVVAAIVGLTWRKSPNDQAQASSSRVTASSVAGTSAPGAGASARSGPVASPEPEDRYPRLPGAMHRLPDWLAREYPFDVNEFSPEIPWDENAAPLYLAAIAEFSGEVATCFPPDQKERIVLRARERTEHYSKFIERWAGDPAHFLDGRTDSDNAELDRLLQEHRTGLQKLALAQERRRCLFETALGMSSLLPHAQGARQVVRILQLKASRELDLQDVTAAIGSLEAGLRLSRDLRPRGFVITQLVSAAMNNVCLRQIAAAIIRAPRCSREQCDRLIALLQEHRRQSLDSWVTGLRGEYVTLRNVVNQVQHRTGDFAPDRIKELMRDFGHSNSGASAGELLAVFSDPNFAPANFPKEIDALNTRLGLMSEKEYAQEAHAVADWYAALEPIGRLPRAQQSTAIAQIQARFSWTLFVSCWQSSLPSALESFRHSETFFRGTLCLVALKRWQLAHREPPTDLVTVLKEAGVGEVPVDPYSGKPFSLAVLAGKPIIYSIGPDGIDDHGEFDNLDGRNESGDVLFQLR